MCAPREMITIHQDVWWIQNSAYRPTPVLSLSLTSLRPVVAIPLLPSLFSVESLTSLW